MTLDKLASLLVEAVNEADDLADDTSVLLYSVRFKNIRNELDSILRRVQRMKERATDDAARS